VNFKNLLCTIGAYVGSEVNKRIFRLSSEGRWLTREAMLKEFKLSNRPLSAIVITTRANLSIVIYFDF
jgi:hypothetical protein